MNPRHAQRLPIVLLIVAMAIAVVQAAGTTFESITVANVAIGFAAATITPVGKSAQQRCSGRLVTAEINYRTDGVAPTAAVGGGIPVEPGDFLEIRTQDELVNFKAIRTGAVSGTLPMQCYPQ